MSTGDLIDFFGVVFGANIAVIALIFSLAYFFRRGAQKRRDRRFSEVKRTVLHCRYALARVEQIVAELELVCTVHATLMTRVISSTGVLSKLPGYASEMARVRSALGKSLQELMLASELEGKKRSAAQQLGQSSGDQYTLDYVNELLALSPNDSVLKTLRSELEQRLKVP